MAQIEITADGHWLWTGRCNDSGYAVVSIRHREYRVHVWIFEQVYGSISDEYELHHVCEFKHCVWPEHVTPLTKSDHAKLGIAAERQARTHCPSGHEYTIENIYWYHGHRQCRQCKRRHRRSTYERGIG